jgi:hypothetical protein
VSSLSPSMVGANPTSARSFQLATSGTANSAAIIRGGYEIVATQDCYLKVARTTGLTAVVALPSAQGAVDITAAGYATIYVAAGVHPLDVPDDGYSVSVLQVSAAGVVAFNGPLSASTNR